MTSPHFRELSRVVERDEFGMAIGLVTVAAPDGRQFQRRYLHAPDAVAIVALDADEIVLVREFRAAVGEAVLAVPMGKVPNGISPRDQAMTEPPDVSRGYLTGRRPRVLSLVTKRNGGCTRRGGSIGLLLIRAMSERTASRPMCSLSGEIVVRVGLLKRPSSMSSNPITAMSSGIRRPASMTARMAPMAMRSL